MFRWKVWFLCFVVLSIPSFAVESMAQTGSIAGAIADPLGAGMPAAVSLYQDGESIRTAASSPAGAYTFTGLQPGRYQVGAVAPGFEPRTSVPVFVGSGNVIVDLVLQIGPLQQHVSVTAAAAELPSAQVGAPVSVIDRSLLDRLGKTDAAEVLRIVPGLSVVQAGQRGATASVFLRGGNSDFNKVLIDGAPANDIGGVFSFDALSLHAAESIEVLRTANSVLYGADAMSGVVSVESRRGRARVPEFEYLVEGGNLGTVRNALSFGGVVRRFDYFVDASRFDTDNDTANSRYRNDTIAARFGAIVASNTEISASVRRTETAMGSAGAVLHTGIADDSHQDTRLTYASISARSAWTNRLRTTARYSYMDRESKFENPAPTGEFYDPFGFGENYLGNTVTITGRNGFSTTGRAILDFGGAYPAVTDADTVRHLVHGQADYRFFESLDLSAGGRMENEKGSSTFSAPAERWNYGAFVEARGSLARRVFVVAGIGFENHAVFGYEAVPRLSAAVYLRRSAPAAVVGETKLSFTVGKGIKAPSVFDEQSSLYALFSSQPGGDALIGQFDVAPVRPARTRGLDLGIEQGFWGGRARARLSYFHNDNRDLIEWVSSTILPQLGVPQDVADAAGFGATVNAMSFRAQGLEAAVDLVPATGLHIAAWYTFLDAVVRESFTGSALSPVINPAFPEIPIGQYAPLVGARPFRRPAHSGSLTVSYVRGPGLVAVTTNFVGRQDDSTFLSDPDFGASMLLPNKDLSGGYRKVDLNGSYRFNRFLRWHAGVENLLNRKFQSAMGFSGLPIAFRTGLQFTVGGTP